MVRRESGVDLIRCFGLFCVVNLHAFLKNGFYGESQLGLSMWAANSFRWLFFGCNGIFMMLTGYLKSTAQPLRKGYFRGLQAVLLSYVLTCLVSFPIRHFLLDETLTLSQWLEKGVTFANYGWYVEMYIGLYLLSPLVNLALNQLQRPRDLLGMAGLLAMLTALPSMTPINLAPDFWGGIYPLTYYVIGAVIQRLQPQVRPWLGLLGAAVIAVGLGLVSALSTDEGFSSGFTQGYGGFWVTAMVTFLFLGFYRVRASAVTGKILAWAAGGCFEGYILSRLLDVWAYARFPQWHSPEYYPLLFLCVTIPIFISSVLMGKLVHAPVSWLMGRRHRPTA